MTLKAYWYTSRRAAGNFGDNLTPALLDAFRIPYEWAPAHEADFFGVGSILHAVPEGFRGIVWTPGVIDAGRSLDLRDAEVLAVRGPMSLAATAVSNRGAVIQGDGGLLSRFLISSVQKRYKLGLVPHYADADDPVVHDVAATSPEIVVIDVRRPVEEVLQLIGACEYVMSSSLHGLVAADSLGVPSRWMALAHGSRVAGKGLKFRDYYASFGLTDQHPVHLTSQMGLDDLLPMTQPEPPDGIELTIDALAASLRDLEQRGQRLHAVAAPHPSTKSQDRALEDERPLVSIIITSHNYAEFVSKTISSAVEQTYGRIEVIVVDDGSTDDSPRVIESFGDAVVAVLKENGGQASAFNAGFERCRGEFVCFVDSDDLLMLATIEEAVDHFDDPSVVKVHWPLIMIDEEDVPTGAFMHLTNLDQGDLRDTLIDAGPAGYNWPSTSGNLWSKRFLDQIMPMPEAEYRIGPDVYLSALAPLYGTVRRVESPLGCYRVHTRNNTFRQPFHERITTALEFWGHCFDILEDRCRAMGLEPNRGQWERCSWWHRTGVAVTELMALVPDGEAVIVAGEDEWATGGHIGERPVLPFPALDGVYWGKPADDADALAALERASGTASFIVFPWWCSYWLDTYPELGRRLRERHPCVLENERLIAFDLRTNTVDAPSLRDPESG